MHPSGEFVKLTTSSLSGIILGMGSANEIQCYNVILFLISWAHTENDPCNWGHGRAFLSKFLSSFANFFMLLSCCLVAPSHYLIQCWLVMNRVLRHASECIFRCAVSINHKNTFKDNILELITFSKGPVSYQMHFIQCKSVMIKHTKFKS